MINGLKAGDTAAQFQIWQKYTDAIERFAQRTQQRYATRNEDAGAEDIAAMVLKSVIIRAQDGCFPNLNDEKGLWALILEITKRKVLNQKRAEEAQKRPPTVSEIALSKGDDDGFSLDDFASAEIPDEDCQVFVDLIEELFKDLDDEHREVALLRLQGYKVREIADRIGRPISTTELRLRSLKAKLLELETPGAS